MLLLGVIVAGCGTLLKVEKLSCVIVLRDRVFWSCWYVAPNLFLGVSIEGKVFIDGCETNIS